jgi:hypothetical protein
MSLFIAAVLIIGVLVGAVAVAIATPVFIGAIAYDLAESRKNAPAKSPEDLRVRIAVERGFARGFVIAGGVFWSIAAFAGLLTFRESGMGAALLAAFYPMVACLATLAIGWYYERVTSALLAIASVAVVVWGVIYQFEMGVWMIMAFALIGPMATAATLFWAARRDQEAFELAVSLRPEMEFAPVAQAKVPTV